MAYSHDPKSTQALDAEVDSLEASDGSTELHRFSRRDLARLAAATSGVLAVETLLPTTWLTPIVHATHIEGHAIGSSPGGGFQIDVKHLPPGVRGSPNALPPAQGGTAGMAGSPGTAGSAGTAGSGGSAGNPGTVTETGTSGVQPGTGADGTGGPCLPPPGFTPQAPLSAYASTITQDSAVVDFSGGIAETYTVEAIPSDPAASTVTVAGVTDSSVRLTGLTPCTNYTIRVTAHACNQTSLSSTIGSFKTKAALTPPVGHLDALSCDAATVAWVAADGCGSSTWNEVEFSEENGPWKYGGGGSGSYATLYNLCPGKHYRVRIRTYFYSTNAYSDFSREVEFTTPTTSRSGGECNRCSDSNSGSSGYSGSQAG